MTTIADAEKCPITFALEIFGDKWSLLIIRDIVFKRKRHYGEFLRSPEKIATNILANRLEKLERHGIVKKSRDPDNATKGIYELTEKGRDLLPVMLELIAWSAKYNPQPGVRDNIIDGAPAKLLARARDDREALLTEILDGLP